MPDREEEIERFLKEQCYTTDEERASAKPLIVKDGLVFPNPEYNKFAPAGTSFFINFHPECTIQGKGIENWSQSILEEIKKQAIDCFTSAFHNIDLNDELAAKLAKAEFHVALEPTRTRANIGEIYFFFPRTLFNEAFIIKLILALKEELIKNPVTIRIAEDSYPIIFYGWGFRYR